MAVPRICVRKYVPPKSPDRPTLAKAVVILAVSEAMRKSQASASDNPAPAAAPSIAAMVGLGISCSRRLTSIRSRKTLICSSSVPVLLRASFIAFTSPPAQNAPPAPVRMTARTSGSSAARDNCSFISRSIARVKAFLRSGRLRVITRVAPWRCVCKKSFIEVPFWSKYCSALPKGSPRATRRQGRIDNQNQTEGMARIVETRTEVAATCLARS